jgi:hypothetical protein
MIIIFFLYFYIFNPIFIRYFGFSYETFWNSLPNHLFYSNNLIIVGILTKENLIYLYLLRIHVFLILLLL